MAEPTENDRTLIREGLRLAADGLAACQGTTIAQGIHISGQFFFMLEGNDRLFSALYREKPYADMKKRGDDPVYGDDAPYAFQPAGGPMIIVRVETNLPYEAAVAFLKREGETDG